jgi:endonuclease-3
MTKQERVAGILPLMDRYYGTDLKCFLHYDSPWQLLFSTIMSAQCTDARVNMVAEKLYKKYPSVQAFAEADIAELEKDIHSVGFFHSKARNLIACARKLMTDFNGEVPSGLEELTSLPGVGRKTANVIRGNVFDEPSVVVDTHVKRVSKRLGLTNETEPEKVEQDLMKILPKDHWILWNLQAISLGREICKAPSPRCESCFLSDYCRSSSRRKAESE